MQQSTPQTLGCIEQAATLLGSKWTGLIIRELAAGSHRFCELERALPALNPRTLSKRLDELEQNQIITRQQAPQQYSLTTKGHDLLPILHEMAAWSLRYPAATAPVAQVQS